MTERVDITFLLEQWRRGDRDAEATLMGAVYPVMRDLARARLRRAPRHITLRATELANEAYARLAGIDDIAWKDRVHFFAVAARAIRNVVVDHLRARGAEKRGGASPFVSLDVDSIGVANDTIDLSVDWLALHDALGELERVDPRSARVVELKFFSGLTNEEIADVTVVSRATVIREWRFARAWLADRLNAY